MFFKSHNRIIEPINPEFWTKKYNNDAVQTHKMDYMLERDYCDTLFELTMFIQHSLASPVSLTQLQDIENTIKKCEGYKKEYKNNTYDELVKTLLIVKDILGHIKENDFDEEYKEIYRHKLKIQQRNTDMVRGREI